MHTKMHHYKKDDAVIIIDPLSPYENREGFIAYADNKLMRYKVRFYKDLADTFWYNQIMPYRPKEMIESLIDLSLTLGPAGKEMFEEWAFEYRQRFK
jgi:hypothetical protein